MGCYFFLLLQTLMTRPMTVTMSIQNWNRSEYVTIGQPSSRKLSQDQRAKKLPPVEG